MKTKNSNPKNTAVYGINVSLVVCLFVNVMYIMPYTNTNPVNHQLKPKDIFYVGQVCVCVCVCVCVAVRLKKKKKINKIYPSFFYSSLCVQLRIVVVVFSSIFSPFPILNPMPSVELSHWGVNQCVTSLIIL